MALQKVGAFIAAQSTKIASCRKSNATRINTPASPRQFPFLLLDDRLSFSSLCVLDVGAAALSCFWCVSKGCGVQNRQLIKLNSLTFCIDESVTSRHVRNSETIHAHRVEDALCVHGTDAVSGPYHSGEERMDLANVDLQRPKHHLPNCKGFGPVSDFRVAVPFQ